MSRAEDVVMRLYEDAALRGDLTDEPANRLLKWAEDRLIALDETAADDAAFESGAAAVLKMVKQINSTVGETLATGGSIADADVQAFTAQAADLGAAVNAEQVKTAAAADEMALVENLIALASGVKADATVVKPDETSLVPTQPVDVAEMSQQMGQKIGGFLKDLSAQLFSEQDAATEDIPQTDTTNDEAADKGEMDDK